MSVSGKSINGMSQEEVQLTLLRVFIAGGSEEEQKAVKDALEDLSVFLEKHGDYGKVAMSLRALELLVEDE